MFDERYVIVTKGDFKKFPFDKRNRFINEGDTTMDILETYLYVEENLAKKDFEDYGFNPEKFEIKKYIINFTEVEQGV